MLLEVPPGEAVDGRGRGFQILRRVIDNAEASPSEKVSCAVILLRTSRRVSIGLRINKARKVRDYSSTS
jgi:hypothetical protein